MPVMPHIRDRSLGAGPAAPMPAALAAFLTFLQDAMVDADGRLEHFLGDRLLAEMNGGNHAVAGSCIVLAMVEDERSGNAPALRASPEVVPVLDGVAALHRRLVKGDAPNRRDWAAARAAAVAVTDATRDPVLAATFSFAEAACWDPNTARSVLVDAGRHWLVNRRERAIRASGWTAADERSALAALRDLQAAVAAPGETRNLGSLFAERNPDLARRYDAQLAVGHDAYQAALWDLARFALFLIGARPDAPGANPLLGGGIADSWSRAS